MIRTVNMQDFCAIPEKVLNLVAGTNVITGTNHAGKSTVRQAIRYALTAQPDKKDPDEIIRQTPDAKTRVVLVCDSQVATDRNTHMISRKAKPHTLELNGAKLAIGKSNDKDGLFEHGYKRNVIKMLCDATNFFDLTPKEQADLLMNYFAADEAIDPTKYGLTKDEAAKIPGLTTGNIQAKAKELREIRASVNKAIEKVKAEIDFIAEKNAGEPIDTEALNKRRAEIDTELSGVRPEFSPGPSSELMTLEAELRGLQNSTYIPKHAARLAEISAKGKANKSIVEAYKTNKGKCPISGGKVDCKESALASFIERLEAETATLRAEYEKLANNDEADNNQFLVEKAKKVQEWSAKVKQAKDAIEKKAAEIEAKNNQIFARINELNAELKTIDEHLAKARDRENDVKKIGDLSKNLTTSERESKTFDKLIAFLESDLKKTIVSGGSGDFFQKVNAVSQLFGFDIQADGDVTNLKINGKTPAMLSTSERIICGIALQIAVAQFSGYNFFVADDLESLNEGYYLHLLSVLARHFKKITSVLIGLDLPKTDTAHNYIVLESPMTLKEMAA